MAKLTLSDIEQIAGRNRPWTLRLESSDAYWYATGRALTEALECGCGKLGQGAQLRLLFWPEFQDVLQDLISQGYQYVSTPYIRMSPAGLAQLTGIMAPKIPQAKIVSSTPIATQTLCGTGPIALAAKLKANVLRMNRQGTKVLNYSYLDARGVEVSVVQPEAAVDFARQHNLEILFA